MRCGSVFLGVFFAAFGSIAEEHPCAEVPDCTTPVVEEMVRLNLLQGAEPRVSFGEKTAGFVWKEELELRKIPLVYRVLFTVEDPTAFHRLKLLKPYDVERVLLNGKEIPLPLLGMGYIIIPDLPASMLKSGENELTATWMQRVRARKDPESGAVTLKPSHVNAEALNIRLVEVLPEDLVFQSGPILGYAGTDFFTVSCRVNLAAEVTLEVDGQILVSEPALLHTFKVEGLAADTSYSYSLKTGAPYEKQSVSTGPYEVKTLPEEGPFTFAILGDSRTHPEDWEKVAAAVTTAKPILSVFVGDMVSDGRVDHQWDVEFFAPAKEFLATIPFYGIMGNHEGNCPLFSQIFATPSGKNWAQEVGPVLLIGIDGNMDWSSEGALAQWLEKLLAETSADFIFLGSHWPAWTSGWHGRLGADGRPRERPILQGQDVIMPLLKKYNASAMFAGHDHIYERSDPTNGVTMVITGGAGAPLSGKRPDGELQNPFSTVFASAFHYCLLAVDGDVCTMNVVDLEGTVIDTYSWDARN